MSKEKSTKNIEIVYFEEDTVLENLIYTGECILPDNTDFDIPIIYSF